jgi:RNA polymerase sigma-70 factor (ECF subfamily)
MLNDQTIVTALRNGDDRAFIALYHRYKEQIYRFCLKMTGDVDTAKDIVQSVFIKVFERHSQVIHGDRLKSWLYTIARNDCITHLRSMNHRATLMDADVYPSTRNQSASYDRDEEVLIVGAAIVRLTPEHREVILLREYENMSYAEIAEVIGISAATVKSRLFSARQKLYEYLKPIYSERIK